MKLTSSVKAFFHHYSLQFGIKTGWDFEQDYADFVNENLEEFKDSVCLTLTTIDLDVTEYDIAMLALGVVTETGEVLLGALLNIAKDYTDSIVLLSSMHSGSSDYLYVKDIRDLFAENIKN